MKKTHRNLITLASLIFLTAPVVAQVPDTVWIWSNHCESGQDMKMIIRRGSKVLHQAIIPICRGNRDAEDGRAAFKFPANTLIHGSHEQEEGDIWQASGDTNDLIIGVSLQRTRRIHLNALHIATADKRASTYLGYGLYITTYPLSANQK